MIVQYDNINKIYYYCFRSSVGYTVTVVRVMRTAAVFLVWLINNYIHENDI